MATARNCKGDDHRNKIRALLKAAGPRGMSCKEIAAGTGRDTSTSSSLCKAMEGELIAAGKCRQNMLRWFHADYAEAAKKHDQFAERMKDIGQKFSPDRIHQAAEYVNKKNGCVRLDELSEALGVHWKSIGKIVSEAALMGLVVRVVRGVQVNKGRAVYVYPVGFNIPDPPPKKKRIRKKKPRAAARKVVQPKKYTVIRSQNMGPKLSQLQRYREAEAIIPPTVKVTVLPGFVPPSFRPEKPIEPLFSALKIGQYPDLPKPGPQLHEIKYVAKPREPEIVEEDDGEEIKWTKREWRSTFKMVSSVFDLGAE